MATFAIVAEGYTDQVVLENVLYGFFEKLEDEPDIRFVQPPDETTQNAPHAPGGWTLVLKYLENGDHRKALQTNDYLVIHIDTDVAQDFDVHAVVDGHQRTPAEIRDATIEKLQSLIPADELSLYGDRLLFAIGVDSIECWLLPLVFDKSMKGKRTKATGCLGDINHELRTKNQPPLARADSKDPEQYKRVSSDFLKRKRVDAECACNVGFERFVEQLRVVESKLSTA